MKQNTLYRIAISVAISAIGISILNLLKIVELEYSLYIFLTMVLVSFVSNWMANKPRSSHSVFSGFENR